MQIIELIVLFVEPNSFLLVIDMQKSKTFHLNI